MNSVELGMVQEAMQLVEAGLGKLVSLESSHPTLVTILHNVGTAVVLGQKLISLYPVAASS